MSISAIESNPEIDRLPAELKAAVLAMNNPEVQEMVRKLDGYGLAVALPHLHNDAGFEILPRDMISMEQNLVTTFFKKADAPLDKKPGVPVVWRWDHEKGVAESARCCTCYTGTDCV
ncbi:MAG: hypothetical protein QM523_02480 [Candidatus Pacebacteria bacterium]|nr:hypothetical protein [Candidatus Paceibacterota bacterium]